MGYQKVEMPLRFFIILASLACQCVSYYGIPSVLEHELNEYPSEERVIELFQNWKENHRKLYTHPDEAALRFEMFKRNLKYIVDKNNAILRSSSPNAHRLGLNRFADMSNEEFRRMYSSKVKKPIGNRISTSTVTVKDVSCTEDVPSSLDWRKNGVVTGVKDQGDCGSCWAFSSTGAMEGINAIVTGDLMSLSEQELVNCDTTNEGCDGGTMDYAFEWVILNGGIDTESDYAYTGLDGTCNIKKEETKVVSIDGYQNVERTDSALLCSTAKQPISVAVDGSSLDFQLYTGGIYDGDCSSNPEDIDHAVLIVGYGTSEEGEDYWIVKNSWGTSWGMAGYIYIRRNTNLKYGVCAINYMASYPTKHSSAAPSPTSPSPPPPPQPRPVVPPPPSSPSPTQCGDFSYCPADETCCCLFKFLDFCVIYGCCEYENGVCCTGTEYCCPGDYPICDIQDGLCLQNWGDVMGVAAKKRTMAKHKLPWTTKSEGLGKRKTSGVLDFKRNPFVAAMR